MSVETKLLEIANNVDKVYKAGINTGKKETMALYYISVKDFQWQNVKFPENFHFVLKTAKTPNTCNGMFSGATNVVSARLECDDKNGTSVLAQTFRNCRDLEMADLRNFNLKASSIAYMAYDAIKLKTILGAFDLSYCTSSTNAFTNSTALTHIEFVPQTIKLDLNFNYSKNLTKESLLSILNGLYDYNVNYSLLSFRPDFFAEGEAVSGTYKITEVDVTNFDINISTEGGYRFKVSKSDCGDEWESIVNAIKVDRYIEFLGDYDSNGVMRFETINLLSNPDSIAYTLNLGATNLNKLTEEEKQIAENKGWTLK